MNVVHLKVVSEDRRERSREKRRRQFLDAAGRLIDREGLDGVTIKRLAEELDCAVGTVYLYFASKSALIAALQAEAVGLLAASYRTARAGWTDVLDAEPLDDPTRVLVELEAFSAFWASASVVYGDEFELQRHLLTDRVELEAADTVAEALALLDGLLAVPVGLLDRAIELEVLEGADSRERAVVWLAALAGVLRLENLAAVDRHLFRAPHLARLLSMDLLTGWGADRADVEIAASVVERLAAHGPMAPPPEGPGWD